MLNIWNYFRCNHCRVYRINWYNNAKKNLVKLQRLANIRIDPKLSSLRGGNQKCGIWNSYFQCSSHCRVYRINWYNNNAAVVSSELFIFGKEKNSWNHHKEGTHRKILTRKIKNARKHNTPYYYLLDAFVYLLNNCCDTQFINFCASNWKKKWYMS